MARARHAPGAMPAGGLTLSYAMGVGALRGMAAGAGFGVLLVVALTVADVQAGKGSWDGAVVVIAAIVAMYAAPIGAVLGAAVGAALLPLARRCRPVAAAVLAGAMVLGLGTLAFPVVPLGARPGSLSEFLTLSALPAACAAASAARHAWRMSVLAREPSLDLRLATA